MLSLLTFVATRGLSHSRLTTVLLILAVAAGVGLQIPNTANLVGYSHTMFEEATTFGFGNVRVQHPTEPLFDDADALAKDLATVAGVQAAVPIVTFPAGLGAHGRQMVCEMHGVDPASPAKPYRIREGSDLRHGQADDDGVLVGTGLASKLGIKPGDKVEVRVLFPPAKVPANPDGSPAEAAPPIVGEYTMTVRGTAQGTFGAYASLFVTRELLTRTIARPHAASRVLVYAGSSSQAAGLSEARHDAPLATEALAHALEQRAPTMQAVTWMKENPLADSALRANEVLGVVSHTMVVIAVTIPVGALLYVTVERRRREIAMLASLGFAKTELFVAFVMQALVIGLAGSLLGCGIGVVMLAWFKVHPIFESAEFVIRPVTTASSFYEPALVILITTVVAAMYPAWRAMRVDPARVLRGAV